MRIKIASIEKYPAVLLTLVCLFTACHHAVIPTQIQTYKSGGKVIRNVIMPVDFDYYVGLNRSKTVYDFYMERNYAPAWFKNDSLSVLVDSMSNIINSARLYGLLPQDYHQFDIKKAKEGRNIDDALVRSDALFTDAFFTIVHHLQHGRLHVTTTASDSVFVALLQLGLKTSELRKVLSTQEPDFAEYRNLKKGLGLLLDSMAVEDRNLLVSGITIDSMEIHRKIQLIEINLERWRWEGQCKSRYIWINIPAYELRVVENENIILKSKIIVGTPARQTPVLSSLIECFVIYPYWHVPRKIAVEELLPVLQRDTSYLRRANFDVLDRRGNVLDRSSIEWQMFTKDYFPVMLRQREGSENSLGIVKFVFDNPYAVYLHDTNAKRFFNNKARALSHGCVRIEKAIELANYLVTGNTYSTSGQVNKYIALKQKHVVNLTYPIPIYTRYFTCAFGNNKLHIYPDIYKKDSILIHEFYSNVMQL